MGIFSIVMESTKIRYLLCQYFFPFLPRLPSFLLFSDHGRPRIYGSGQTEMGFEL